MERHENGPLLEDWFLYQFSWLFVNTFCAGRVALSAHKKRIQEPDTEFLFESTFKR